MSLLANDGFCVSSAATPVGLGTITVMASGKSALGGMLDAFKSHTEEGEVDVC
jgi:hypothetical protein